MTRTITVLSPARELTDAHPPLAAVLYQPRVSTYHIMGRHVRERSPLKFIDYRDENATDGCPYAHGTLLFATVQVPTKQASSSLKGEKERGGLFLKTRRRHLAFRLRPAGDWEDPTTSHQLRCEGNDLV